MKFGVVCVCVCVFKICVWCVGSRVGPSTCTCTWTSVQIFMYLYLEFKMLLVLVLGLRYKVLEYYQVHCKSSGMAKTKICKKWLIHQ